MLALDALILRVSRVDYITTWHGELASCAYLAEFNNLDIRVKSCTIYLSSHSTLKFVLVTDHDHETWKSLELCKYGLKTCDLKV